MLSTFVLFFTIMVAVECSKLPENLGIVKELTEAVHSLETKAAETDPRRNEDIRIIHETVSRRDEEMRRIDEESRRDEDMRMIHETELRRDEEMRRIHEAESRRDEEMRMIHETESRRDEEMRMIHAEMKQMKLEIDEVITDLLEVTHTLKAKYAETEIKKM